MPLRELYELYDRLLSQRSEYGIVRPGRSIQKIAFAVVVDRQGTLVDIQDISEEHNGRKEPLRMEVLGVTKPSGSGLNPCFLWDSVGYMLGWGADEKKRERALRTFEAFREKHLLVESEIRSEAFSAVCAFLRSWSPSRARKFEDVLAELQAGFGVFRLQGENRFVHEDEAIQEWWDRRTEGDSERMKTWWTASESAVHLPIRQCLVTGSSAPIARLHEPKIKGVCGSQPSGATIVSFNDPAYCSFGLEQSYNAPVSVEAAQRYAIALNALLDGPQRDRHRIVVGDTTVAFWTDRPTVVEDVFATFASEGSLALESVQDEGVRQKLAVFLRALKKGREVYSELAEAPEETAFYVVGLAAPTPARVAVRFFHKSSVADFLDRLREHHFHIAIERRFGESSRNPEPEVPSVGALLSSLRVTGGETPSVLNAGLMEAVLTGRHYPNSLYQLALRRIAVDHEVSYLRAALIKGILVRNFGKEVTMSLDPSCRNPAYRLGRLFAVLERTQRDALGEQLNATIRDRFYSSASATPGVIFPRLLRTYQHHLAKLEPGWRVNREKLVQEILDPLEHFPTHLDLVEQGLFALGYYHQMNAFFRRHDETESEKRQETN